MTYIVGFRSKDSVFLCADMATTLKGENLSKQSEYSSFGESSYQKEDFLVEESANKITKIADSTIVTYAGNQKIGDEILRILLQQVDHFGIDNFQHFKELFSNSINSCTTPASGELPSFIFGLYLDNEPLLISYNITKKHDFEIHQYFIQTGSIPDYYKAMTLEYYKFQVSRTITDKTRLILMNSLLQSYGYRDRNLMKKGIGGCFFGIMVSSQGIKWQDDTVVILYQRNNCISNTFLIKTVERDNVIAISSPFLVKKSAYLNNLSTDVGVENWIKKWTNRLHDVLNDLETKYYVFLEKNSNKIISLSRQNKSLSNSKYLKIQKISENQLGIGFSSEILSYLLYNPHSALPIEEKGKDRFHGFDIHLLVE